MSRLRATLRTAASSSSVLEARQAEVDRAAAERRASATLGSPTVEWQREGVDSSFDRAPNAQDAVRVAKEFRLPGQASAAGDYRERVGAWRDSRRSADRWDLLAEVAVGWLELAAATERERIVADRWQRLDEALALQEARYQLGEVSGSEVTQLDLEHVRESSRLAALRSERSAVAASLRGLVGGALDEPRRGDLEELAAATRSTPSGVATGWTPAGPLASAARADASVSEAASTLVARSAWGLPEAELEWERVPDLAGARGFDAYGGRIRLPLPLGAGARERRAAAEAEHAAAARRMQARLEVLGRRAEAAAERAQGADERLVALRPALGTLPDTAASLAQQFRLGAISYLVYIDALSRLDEIRLEAVEARLALLAARLELAVVTADPAVFPLAVDGMEEGS